MNYTYSSEALFLHPVFTLRHQQHLKLRHRLIFSIQILLFQAYEIQSLPQNHQSYFGPKFTFHPLAAKSLLANFRFHVIATNPSLVFAAAFFQHLPRPLLLFHVSLPCSTNGYNSYTFSWATASITTEALVPSILCLHCDTNHA